MIGLLCIWAALKSRDGKASETKLPEAELTPMYCFGYGAVVNFIGVPFAVVLVGDRCKPLLEKTNDRLIRLVDTVMPIFLLLIGVALTADAVAYFSTGKPLW